MQLFMIKPVRYFLLPAIIFFCENVLAQQYASSLYQYQVNTNIEKIYLHLDKDHYVAGETIWFKAYLYNNGMPANASRNVYLRFVDDKGVVLVQKKLPVEASTAKGELAIPDSITGGNYLLEAFTPAMLNGDPVFFYKRNIPVFSPLKINVVQVTGQVSLQFFPESGELVDGIISTVAFKAVNESGMPTTVTGAIKGADGVVVTNFNSYHDGMGKLQFKPVAGVQYIAEIDQPSGKKTFLLPEVKTSGINLKVQDETGGKKFQLTRSKTNKDQFDRLTLVVQINNHVVFENEIEFENYQSVNGHILTDSLPSGILHFAVFNKDGLPLAERLSFVNNREYAAGTTLKTITFSSAKRAANELQISFTDKFQRRCSVAITDGDAPISSDRESVWSRLLLTSDLKGQVFNAAWYFNNKTDSAAQALDNLLLTHGWSRFRWEKIISPQPVKPLITDQAFLSLSGTVIMEDDRRPVANGKLNIYLEAEDSASQNHEVQLNEKGKFSVDSLVFIGHTKLFYAYTDQRGKVKSVLLQLDSNQLDKAVNVVPVMLPTPPVTGNTISLAAREIDRRFQFQSYKIPVKELEGVTMVTSSKKKPIEILNDKYATGVFKQMGKVNLDNVNNPLNDNTVTAVDYIKNRIRQLTIQNNTFVNIKNFSIGTNEKWAVGIVLNEVPADISQLNILRATDIALVKFYDAGFIGVGSGFPGGAIAVYTKDRSSTAPKPDKLKYVEYEGYSLVREFYHPDYSDTTLNPAADKRTTLYWNPDLYTDANAQTIQLPFYNNDNSRVFRVILEGFDASGKLIHEEQLIHQ